MTSRSTSGKQQAFEWGALLPPLLFVVFVCWYGASEEGPLCSNDGSSYALTKAVVEEKSLSIGKKDEMMSFLGEGLLIRYSDDAPENARRYWMLTEATDIAVRDGLLYSDRSPAVPFLAIPFYTAGLAVEKIVPPERWPFFHQPLQVPRGRDCWNYVKQCYVTGKNHIDLGLLPESRSSMNPAIRYYWRGRDGLPLPPEPTVSGVEKTRQYFATLVSAVTGSLAVVFIFLCSRLLGLRSSTSVWVGVVYGLCTMQAKYATTMFSHATAGFFVVLSLYFVLAIGRGGKRKPLNYFLLGIAAAAAVVSEYPNALIAAGVLVYLAAQDVRQSASDGRWIRRYSLLFMGLLIPLAALGVYNKLCFGGFFSTSYRYQLHFHYNKDLLTAFSAPLGKGLWDLLLNPQTAGLFLASPVLILALLGFFRFYGACRAEALLVGVLFLLMVLAMAKKVEATGGGSQDPRYLAASMGLTFWASGSSWRRLRREPGNPSRESWDDRYFLFSLLFRHWPSSITLWLSCRGSPSRIGCGARRSSFRGIGGLS